MILALFHFYIFITSSDNDESEISVQESLRVKILVENNHNFDTKINPFNLELVLITIVKNTIPIDNHYDIEFYIASFKEKSVTKLDLAITRFLDSTPDVFWVTNFVVLFDQSMRKYHFLNNSLPSPPLITLPTGYDRLIINLYYPNMIVAVKNHNPSVNMVSIDYGTNYVSLPQGCADFVWISETHLLVFLHAEVNTLYVRNYSEPSNEDMLKVESIIHFKVVDQYIFLITRINAQSPYKYFMFDAISNKLNEMMMTINYEDPIFQSIHYDEDFIFIVFHHKDDKCLLRSHRNTLKFYSLICGVEEITEKQYCPFSFSKKPHVIYVNTFNKELKTYETIYSKDDGDSWNRFIMRPNENSEQFDYSYIRLKLAYGIKRSKNLNPYNFEIFNGNVKIGSKVNSIQVSSNNIGMLKKLELFSQYISILYHGEIIISTPFREFYFYVYYKTKNVYQRILFRTNNDMFTESNLVNEKYSSFISFQIEFSKTAETYLNIVFYDINLLSISLCDVSNYHISADVCKKGQLYRYFKKNDDSLCFTPLDFKFVTALSKCACSFDEFYCKLNYKVKEHICSPKNTQFDTDLSCNDGKLNLNHMNGIREILDDKCEYDFASDDNPVQQNLCGYLDNPDFLKIILHSKTITVYMDRHGKHFSRPPIHVENNILHEMISDIWDYDVHRDAIYFAIGNIIYTIKRAIFGGSHAQSYQLYWMENKISGIVYDYSSHSLFVSDSMSNMFQLSLKTNYFKKYPINGRILSFNNIVRTISYINGSNILCTQKVYRNPTCINLSESVSYGYFDLDTETTFLLYSNKSLIVQQLKDKDSILLEIPDVSFIRIIDYSLYFLSKTTIYYINMKHPSLYYRIVDLLTPDIKMIFIRDSYKDSQTISLNCDYMHEVDDRFHESCVCPTGSIQNENKCSCPSNIKYQKSLCLGFFCNNSICLRNSVKCNRVNDCEDQTDEFKCTVKCPEHEHMCNDACQSKRLICSGINPQAKIEYCHASVFNATLFWSLLSVCLICLALLGLFGYFCHNKTKFRKQQQKFSDVFMYRRNE